MSDKNNKRWFAAAIVLLLPCMKSEAFDEIPFDFQLDLEQQRINLEQNSELKTNALGLRYRDKTGWPLGLDLYLGYMNASHEDDPSTVGYDTSGYYIGLGMNTATSAEKKLQSGFDLSYVYYSASDTVTTQTLELTWAQLEARLWLMIQVSERIKPYACAIYFNLDGKQTFKSTSISQQDLNNQDNAGVCAGVLFEMPDNGFVGLEGTGGAKDGVKVYFGKRFHY